MSAGDELARAFREDRAATLAALTRRVRDLTLAEDAVSQAFAAAVVAWERDGVPTSTRGWLVTTAWRAALDAMRRDDTQARLRQASAQRVPYSGIERELHPLDDDLLRLMVLCAHPSLSPAAQVALTLRCVAGLDTGAVARLLLVAVPTAAQRIVRAKRRVRDAGASFALPDATELPARLVAVRAVVHAMFTEGHAPSRGDAAVWPQLCDEAVWLARLLCRMQPDDVETAGLLALVLLTHARTPARTGPGGAVILLGDQDRRRWDADMIAEGMDILATARRGRPPGRYWLEAEIAAEHGRATSDADADWPRIAALHAALHHLTGSPAVAINRAVAVGRADGAQAGLAVLAPVLADPSTRPWAMLHAAHGELLSRADRPAEAAGAWARALERTRTGPHRDALARRRDALLRAALS